MSKFHLRLQKFCGKMHTWFFCNKRTRWPNKSSLKTVLFCKQLIYKLCCFVPWLYGWTVCNFSVSARSGTKITAASAGAQCNKCAASMSTINDQAIAAFIFCPQGSNELWMARLCGRRTLIQNHVSFSLSLARCPHINCSSRFATFYLFVYTQIFFSLRSSHSGFKYLYLLKKSFADRYK